MTFKILNKRQQSRNCQFAQKAKICYNYIVKFHLEKQKTICII